MKWSMMVTGRSMQFNLTPENEHEKEVFNTLRKFQGKATIHKGVNINECQGGYIRDFGEESSSIAINILRGELKLAVGTDQTPEGVHVTVMETDGEYSTVVYSEFHPAEKVVAPSE